MWLQLLGYVSISWKGPKPQNLVLSRHWKCPDCCCSIGPSISNVSDMNDIAFKKAAMPSLRPIDLVRFHDSLFFFLPKSNIDTKKHVFFFKCISGFKYGYFWYPCLVFGVYLRIYIKWVCLFTGSCMLFFCNTVLYHHVITMVFCHCMSRGWANQSIWKDGSQLAWFECFWVDGHSWGFSKTDPKQA